MLLRLMPSVEALCSRAEVVGADARHAQKNQAQIEAHNEAVVPMDAIHKALTDAPQCHQLEQILGGDGDIGDLPCDGGTGGDGDTGIGLRQGRESLTPSPIMMTCVRRHASRRMKSALSSGRTSA